jgi:hypothetical protein
MINALDRKVEFVLVPLRVAAILAAAIADRSAPAVLGAPCFQRLEPLGHGLEGRGAAARDGYPAFSQFVGDADLAKGRLFNDSPWPSFFVLDRYSNPHEMVPPSRSLR